MQRPPRRHLQSDQGHHHHHHQSLSPPTPSHYLPSDQAEPRWCIFVDHFMYDQPSWIMGKCIYVQHFMLNTTIDQIEQLGLKSFVNSKQSFAGLDKSRNAGSFRVIFGTSKVTTVYDDGDGDATTTKPSSSSPCLSSQPSASHNLHSDQSWANVRRPQDPCNQISDQYFEVLRFFRSLSQKKIPHFITWQNRHKWAKPARFTKSLFSFRTFDLHQFI